MTIPQVIAVALVALVNGFAIAVVICRHYVVAPLEETEMALRKELKTLRGDLWTRTLEVSNLQCWVMMDRKWKAEGYVVTPERKIPRRARSDVLFIPNPEDLLK